MSEVQQQSPPLQIAVAAAKAGNPALAKLQLQKAVEAAPDDPAVWLWMGWLADSPASSTQCFEMALTSEQYRALAETGIAFTKALAEFQVDSDSAFVAPASAPSEAVSPEVPAPDPVEAVDQMVAAVESLQQDEVTDGITHSSGDVGSAESDQKAGASTDEDQVEVSSVENDSDSEDSMSNAVSQNANESEHSSDDESNEPDSHIAEDSAEDLAEAEAVWSQAFAAETSQKAVTAENAETDAPQPEDVEEKTDHTDLKPTPPEASSENSLWQPFDNQGAVETSETDPETTPHQQSETDDSADEFVFVSDDEDSVTDFDPTPISDPSGAASTPTENSSWNDPAPQAEEAAVWRAAQTDWFSVEKPVSPPAPTQSVSPQPPAEHPPASAATQSDSEYSDADSAAGSTAEQEEPTQLPELVDPQNAGTEGADQTSPPSNEKPATSRITASDVWQTAAAEKSTFKETRAIATPEILIPGESSTAASQNEFPSAPAVPTVNPPADTVPIPAPVGPISELPQATVAVQSDQTDLPGSEQTPGEAHRSGRDILERKTILVVDDSPTVRKLVAMTLEKRGFKVVAAFDGVAAIKEIAAHNPALILMDVNMPRLDGYQLCKLVKKHESTRDIPVLMLSGKDGMFDRLRGRLVGCSGYVSKPFAPEELLKTVEEHVSESSGN